MARHSFYKLSEIAELSSGNSIPAATKAAKYAGLNEGTPYIATKDVGFDCVVNYDSGVRIPQDDVARFRFAYPGSVFVCAEGGSAGRKVGLVEQQVCFGNKLFCLRPSDKVDPEYLFYFCRSLAFKDQFKQLMSGVIGGVSKKKFEGIQIPIPSLQEQRAISRKLRVFETQFTDLKETHLLANKTGLELQLSNIESLIGVHVSLDTDKEADFHAALALMKNSLPSGWRFATLAELSRKITDGVHHTPQYVDDGIPFLTVKNLTAGRGISFEHIKYITPEAHADYCKRAKPERGDILISKDGTIGVVRLIDTDIEFSIFVSVAMIQLNDKALSKYVYYAMQSPSVQRQITPKGAALKHLYLEDLRRMVLPIPPAAELDRICEILSNREQHTQKLDELAEEKEALVEELWEATLANALLGEADLVQGLAA